MFASTSNVVATASGHVAHADDDGLLLGYPTDRLPRRSLARRPAGRVDTNDDGLDVRIATGRLSLLYGVCHQLLATDPPSKPSCPSP